MKKYIFIFLSVYCVLGYSQNNHPLQSVVSEKDADSVKIDALSKLFFQEINSDLENSKKYYNAILEIAQRKNSHFAYAKAYNCKGVYCDISGKLDSAYYYYNRAIIHARKANSKAVEGSAYNNIGLLDWNKGDFYKSIKNYSRALKIFEEIKREDLQANTLSNIGLIYFDLEENTKSEEYLVKALNIRKKINDQYGLSVSYVNLGKLLEKQNKYQLAIQNYNKGIEIKEKLEDFLGIAIAKSNMSNIYLKLNQPNVALKHIQDSEAICLKNDAESNIMENVYIGYVQTYLALGNIELAKKYNEKFFELNKKINDQSRLSYYFKFKAALGVMENNYKEAYVNFRIFDSLSAITEGVDLKKSVSLFETKYQTAKKEKLLLKREIEAKQKNTTILILAIVVLFIALLGFLIYRQQRLKNRQQEQEFYLQTAIAKIESQNKLHEQRLSISRDLHDNIGAQLTFVISSIDNLKLQGTIVNSKIDNQLNLISEFTKSTIIELRDTIWAMNSDSFTFEDLRSRMFNFIDKAESCTSNLNISFNINDSLLKHKLGSICGITIYRVIQEAINNSIKHSKGSKIEVSIDEFEDKIKVSIQDNGIGFDLETVDLGNGILNMQKRIDDVKGKFELKSNLAKGTLIEIIV